LYGGGTAIELVKLLDFTEDQINLDRIPVYIQMVFYLKSIRQLTTFQQQQGLRNW
jgi:hypothetical protein